MFDAFAGEKGKLIGRVLGEALPNGAMLAVQKFTPRSEPGAAGLRTAVVTQTVNRTSYFDAVGYPGRILGLPACRRTWRSRASQSGTPA